MSSQVDQQVIWAPPVIATIVYRVVMIIVSIAFIWKKYRRPARQIDEEQLVGILLPMVKSSIRRTRSANEIVPRGNAVSVPCQTPTLTLRQVILAHIKDAIQPSLGFVDVGELLDSLSLPLYDLSTRLSIDTAGPPPLHTHAGLEIDLEDMRLRHRSVETVIDAKKAPKYPHFEDNVS